MHPTNPAPKYIYQIIDAYAQVEDNLRSHAAKFPPAAAYPTAQYLQKTVFTGNRDHGKNQHFGMDDVGIGLSSPGSNHIIDVLSKEDDRNVWILVWGGANTVAQAILDINSSSSIDDTKKQEMLSKLRVYDIAGQDDAGGWIAYHYPDIMYIRSRYQYRGMAYHSCYEHGKEYAIYRSEECPPEQYCCVISDDQGGNPDIFTPGWIQKNIKTENHPLGGVYPKKGSSWSEGQSPTFLYLVNSALSFPDSIAWGGWGGRFKRTKDCGPEARFDEDYILSYDFEQDYCMYVPASDWAYTPRLEKPAWNRLAPVFRWREDMSWDFMARMNWAVNHVDSVNHPPSITLENHLAEIPLILDVTARDTVCINASKSFDPDGDSLHFTWWVYQEPGTYHRHYELDNAINPQDSSIVNFYVPKDAAPGTSIHVILELKDNGEPNLKTYQRVVLHIGME